MAQNPNPFGFQYGPMTPTGLATFQPEEAAPSFPPRPRLQRRPVPTPGAAASQWPASPTRAPQSGELGGGSPSSSLRSPPTYNFSHPDPGYAHIPAMPAPGAASPGCPEFQPRRRHSLFGSTVRKLAKVAFLEFISPGLSTVLASDHPAVPNPTQPASSPGIQPGRVVVNGVALGQADLLALQSAVGPVSPGSYWYDSISGAYGTVGGPCSGFLPAGPALGGGPLAPDASGHTGTGVFINGREIHGIDVAGLQSMGNVVMPGRWWVKADGSYGAEGSFLVLGNLSMQAASVANNFGGAQTWSTSQGNYGGSDGQGFMYVGGPGWSWSN